MSDSRTRKKKAEAVKNPQDVLNTLPIQLWPWPRIAAFVPQFPALPYADITFSAFWGIAQQGVPLLRVNYGRTDVVRNRAAQVLLQSDFTHVLMLDADHQHPTKIVQLLARHVLNNPDVKIVGGMNFRRGAPFDPCCYVKSDDGRLFPPTAWPKGTSLRSRQITRNGDHPRRTPLRIPSNIRRHDPRSKQNNPKPQRIPQRPQTVHERHALNRLG